MHSSSCVSLANRDSPFAEGTHAETHLRSYIANIRDFGEIQSEDFYRRFTMS